MSQKMSAQRRVAFLRALEATGNVTLSAERAKVSRSWVALHRKEHPEFDAGCRAAVARAKASFDRLRMNGSMKPPRGWGSLDGVSLVVRGTGGSGGGKRCQIGRARLKQWCPRTEDRFLATLAATCNVKAACAEVGLTQGSAYNHRNRWSAFAKRWDAAVETGYARLEMGLFENAGNMFSARELPADVDMPPMRVDEAIHLLYMHKHKMEGIGGRTGGWGAKASPDELADAIERELKVLERGRGVTRAQRAQDEADWARRRDAGT